MVEKFSPFDPAEFLRSKEDVEVFLSDAFETSNAEHITVALGIVARAKGMPALATRTGLTREHLSQALSAEGNLSLKTTLAILKSLGLSLAVVSDQSKSG